MKFILNRFFYFITFFVFTSFFLISSTFIDSVNIRKQFFLNEDWFSLPDKVLTLNDRNSTFIVVIKHSENSHQVYFYSPKNNEYLERYNYGGFAYLFDKNKQLVKVKVYIHHKHDSYILFDKSKENRADLYLFGKLYLKDIIYNFPIDNLKIISFHSIKTLLSKDNIGENILIEEDNSDIRLKFIEKIIKPALKFKYVNDGGRNEFGDFVFIKDETLQPKGKEGLNCSGFVKEVMDNYIRLKLPEFKWLDIKSLKRKRLEERVNVNFRYDEAEDSFFGYDWAKNLCDKVNEYYNYNLIKAHEYDKDTHLPFIRFRGYNVEDLMEILFRDQKNDTSFFYLLVFNRLREQPPIIYQANHLAIAVTYFKDNQFYVRFFESCKETDFSNILKYRKDHKVLIIKVPIPFSYL